MISGCRGHRARLCFRDFDNFDWGRDHNRFRRFRPQKPLQNRCGLQQHLVGSVPITGAGLGIGLCEEGFHD